MSKPRLVPLLLAAFSLLSIPASAEYGYFDDAKSGSDIVVKEVRWPYWNSYYYNTWWSQDWVSAEGSSGYWYNGLALPAAGSGNPVGTQQTLNWSFWPISNPVNILDTITPAWTSPNTFSMATIGEGTIARAPGKWTLWQTNVWYRMVLRIWQPVSGAPHLGYAGSWMRDPVAGVWYHMASVQLPFTVTGIDGSMSFQENASGGSSPQRTDYRASYYHYNGVWNSSTNWHAYDHGGGQENAGLIETNTAIYYETCKSNGVYFGTITPSSPTSPTYHISQPATQSFDPIIVTNYSATLYTNQLLVQWQTPAASSPQFAYQINVYTNAGYTGTVVASAYDIAPEAQQKLLVYTNGVTPYARLTIIDVFNQTNAPINLTASNATLTAAVSAPGAVNGLNYAYYQSATSYTTDSSTNWSSMPNFAALTPISKGAVSGLDMTPRQRRNGYAFNYTGYLNVASNGLYTFTLNSCDGSKLYVDGQLVVNNDGEHSPEDLSGWMGLQAGYHTLNVQYFFDTQPTSLFSDYFDTLALSYEGPGIGKTAVPVSAFYRVPGGTEPTVSLLSPTNNATLSGTSVPLSASVTPNGNTINSVQFYVGNTYWGQDTASPYNLNSFFWANAGNAIRARVLYNSTNMIDSAVTYVNTTNMAVAPWQLGQIFYHNYPSGASIVSGTYSLIGDGVNLLSRQINGDCTLIAHLSGLPSTAAKPDGSTPNTGWLGGIILRGTTNMVPGYPWGQSGTAPFVSVFGQVDGGTYYQDEKMVNGGGGYSRSVSSQKWFKLVRTNGTNFTSFISSDGTSWSQVGNTNLTDFGTTIYAGLYTYAGPSSNPSIHWASFDNVSITGNLVGPPGVTVVPTSDTAYTGQTTTFTAMPSGNAPFAYQWQYNNVNLTGATNATLSLTNVQPSGSGLYTVQLSNSNGTASATATLTVLTPPPATGQIISNNPVGYWRLNEATGPTAYDSVGNNNATGEGGLTFGVPGVTNAPFTGFESGNLAAQFNGTDSDVAIPALNLTTTNFTVTGWIKRSGTQAANAGIVYCRSGTTTSGLQFGNANELRYTWNNTSGTYNWNSGLIPPDGVWTFVALTIEPTRGILYMATNGTLVSATNVVANAVQAFAGTTYMGYDPNSSARRITGVLDEVAIFNRTLTSVQLGQILSASLQLAPAVSLTSPANGAGFAAPATISLIANVTTNGHAINYVQYYNGASLIGVSSNAPYSITWTNVAAGAYSVFAQMVYDTTNSAASAPAFITVNQLPAAPATVTATALATNVISVIWSAAPYATSYTLSRNGTPLVTLSATNYLDVGVIANSNYCYSVVAANIYGASSPSASSCVTTPSSGGAFEWDAGGSLTGSQDGNGNWGNSSPTWWNGSANVAWSDNKLAIFGAGTTTNCTATLTNDVTPSGILFNANNGGSYDLVSSANGTSHLILSGSLTVTVNNDATIDADLNGSGQLIKTGPATLTLTGGNTNTGAIIVKGGRLLATGGGWYASRSIGSGSLTVSNGAVAEFSVAHGFGAGSGGYAATLTSGGSLQFDHENYVSGLTITAGNIIGAGEIRTVSATYNINGAATSSLFSCNVNLVSSCTFNVGKGSSATDLTVSGTVYGAGGFTKSGTGLMQLTGGGTYAGTTTISAGTLQVDGSLGTNLVTVASSATLAGTGIVNGATTNLSNGTIAPGDAGIGTLSFSNSLTLNIGSKTLMELSKNGGVPTNDLMIVAGPLTFGGTLTVTNIGTNALAAGDSFKLFNAGSFVGSFNATNLPPLAAGLIWNTNNLTVNGRISVSNIIYTLTYQAGANGSISGTNIQTLSYGASGSAVTAVPNANFHFVNWSDGSTANPRTDTSVTNSLTVTANFAINTLTLTYIAGTNGIISGTSPQTVNYGANGSQVTAVPTNGYHFVNWSDSSTSNPRTDLNVTNSITVTANFAINTYTLTYTAVTNGIISGTSPQTVNYGSNGVAVTAVPTNGYHFVNWSDNSTANPRTDLNVTNTITVTAIFVINAYTLTYTAETNGTISGTSPQTVNYGSNGMAVTAVPTNGYHFVNWSDSSTSNPRTDLNVTNSITVTANFAINTYTLTYTAVTNGTISGTSPQTVNYGSNGVAVTALPDTGYHFANWSDTSTSNPRTDLNVTNSIAVTANFAANPATTVVLTSPAGGSGYPAPATISLAAVVTTNGNVINKVHSSGTPTI